MDTNTIIQESCSNITWLVPLITGTIGALIGTYGGACFLHRKQEKKIRHVRLMAVKALNIFKTYAQQKRSYSDAVNEFNTKLSVSEKRAVLVALHKLGLPVETPTRNTLDIKNIRLKEVMIDKDEIEAMIEQINRGNCDTLFFADIESYFTSNLRLNAVRNIGKKYVEEVHAKSRVDKENPRRIINPDNWNQLFTPGELQTIFVLRTQLANTSYFTNDGNADMKKINTLVSEIEIGLWDNYLFFDYESFSNIVAQHNLANVVQNMIIMNQQQVTNQNIPL